MTKGKKENLIGKVFNGMEVLSEERRGHTKYFLKMKCHCGNVKAFNKARVKKLEARSCGCLPRKQYEGKHGDYKTKIYKNYHSMKDRCYKETKDCYHNYGGRGIKMCDEWLGEDGYLNFKEWALNNGYKDGRNISLDRIDVNGDYSPINCRYTDAKTQGRNKRDNWYEYYNGEKRLVIELCEELGFKYNTIAGRKHRGWSSEDLFKNL